MSKFSNFLGDKFFSGKTKVHLFQPKSINLYFKKSINPNFKIINLENINSVEFYIDEKIEDNIKIFVLKSKINNDNNNIIDVANFSHKEEAESALREVRCNSSTPIKTVGKWLIIFAMFAMFINISFGIVSLFVRGKAQQTQTVSQLNLPTLEQAEKELGLPPGTVPRGGDSSQVQQLMKELEYAKNTPATTEIAPTGPQNETESQPSQEMPMSPTDKLLKGLQ